ncbi:hypothetical protein MD484_g8882, partial [Candolleomyces efflorescens]
MPDSSQRDHSSTDEEMVHIPHKNMIFEDTEGDSDDAEDVQRKGKHIYEKDTDEEMAPLPPPRLELEDSEADEQRISNSRAVQGFGLENGVAGESRITSGCPSESLKEKSECILATMEEESDEGDDCDIALVESQLLGSGADPEQEAGVNGVHSRSEQEDISLKEAPNTATDIRKPETVGKNVSVNDTSMPDVVHDLFVKERSGIEPNLRMSEGEGAEPGTPISVHRQYGKEEVALWAVQDRNHACVRTEEDVAGSAQERSQELGAGFNMSEDEEPAPILGHKRIAADEQMAEDGTKEIKQLPVVARPSDRDEPAAGAKEPTLGAVPYMDEDEEPALQLVRKPIADGEVDATQVGGRETVRSVIASDYEELFSSREELADTARGIDDRPPKRTIKEDSREEKKDGRVTGSKAISDADAQMSVDHGLLLRGDTGGGLSEERSPAFLLPRQLHIGKNLHNGAGMDERMEEWIANEEQESSAGGSHSVDADVEMFEGEESTLNIEKASDTPALNTNSHHEPSETHQPAATRQTSRKGMIGSDNDSPQDDEPARLRPVPPQTIEDMEEMTDTEARSPYPRMLGGGNPAFEVSRHRTAEDEVSQLDGDAQMSDSEEPAMEVKRRLATEDEVSDGAQMSDIEESAMEVRRHQAIEDEASQSDGAQMSDIEELAMEVKRSRAAEDEVSQSDDGAQMSDSVEPVLGVMRHWAAENEVSRGDSQVSGREGPGLWKVWSPFFEQEDSPEEPHFNDVCHDRLDPQGRLRFGRASHGSMSGGEESVPRRLAFQQPVEEDEEEAEGSMLTDVEEPALMVTRCRAIEDTMSQPVDDAQMSEGDEPAFKKVQYTIIGQEEESVHASISRDQVDEPAWSRPAPRKISIDSDEEKFGGDDPASRPGSGRTRPAVEDVRQGDEVGVVVEEEENIQGIQGAASRVSDNEFHVATILPRHNQVCAKALHQPINEDKEMVGGPWGCASHISDSEEPALKVPSHQTAEDEVSQTDDCAYTSDEEEPALRQARYPIIEGEDDTHTLLNQQSDAEEAVLTTDKPRRISIDSDGVMSGYDEPAFTRPHQLSIEEDAMKEGSDSEEAAMQVARHRAAPDEESQSDVEMVEGTNPRPKRRYAIDEEEDGTLPPMDVHYEESGSDEWAPNRRDGTTRRATERDDDDSMLGDDADGPVIEDEEPALTRPRFPVVEEEEQADTLPFNATTGHSKEAVRERIISSDLEADCEDNNLGIVFISFTRVDLVLRLTNPGNLEDEDEPVPVLKRGIVICQEEINEGPESIWVAFEIDGST